jgi:hypothetical protein
MKTRVVNLKVEAFDIYIGRPSKWGNPYRIGRDGTREEVIKKYSDWFMTTELVLALHELKGKRLGCYCKPLACHGDFLVHLIEMEAEFDVKEKESKNGDSVEEG